MQKTHPLRNGHYFRFDEKTPQTGLAGHRFYRAEKVFLDAQGRERPVDPGEKYMLIECCRVWNDDPDFRSWVDRMNAPEQTAKLPPVLLRPVMTHTMPSGHAAWIARCPDSRLVLKSARFHDCALMAEGYAYGIAMAEKHRLTPTNVFYDEAGGAVMIDSSPGMMTRERHGVQWLGEYLRAYAPPLAKHAAGEESREAYYAFRGLNSRRRELQNADEKSEPVAAEMNFVLTRRKTMMPISRPEVSRARYVAAVNRPAVRLSDIFPDQSPITLMGLGAKEETGLLYLTNLTDADWRCSRYGGMHVRADGELMLRAGEEITVPLSKGTTLTFSIRRFETRRIRENRPPVMQAQRSACADPQPAAGQNPVQAAAVPAKPAPAGLPFDDLYEYDSQKLPPVGGSVKAWERSSGKRVRIEVHEPDCEWLDSWMEQLNDPLPPIGGWAGLVNVHPADGCVLLVLEEAQRAGYVQAGSPALKTIAPERLYEAGGNMMRLLDHAAGRNWLPARFEESSLLIHPGTMEALFTGGGYLTRPQRMPFDCGMGYGAPETYRAGACADGAALNFAAAVWLYRLLVGGYPMEGKAVRAKIRGMDASEAGLEQMLYAEQALFVFDPENRSNSIDGLGASFEEQIRRYEALDERVKAGFEQAFCRSLHTRQDERWTPAQWVDVLRGCTKGG